MQGLCRRYLQVVDGINKVTGWLMALMLAVMTVFIFWQVFARFVVGDSLTFSEELSRFLMIWLTMLGSAYALRKGTLIAVDMLPDMLKGNAKKVVKTLISFMVIIFSGVLVTHGWEMSMLVSTQKAPSTTISMFYPMFALPTGGFLLILNSIAVLIEEFIGQQSMVASVSSKGEFTERPELHAKSFNL